MPRTTTTTHESENPTLTGAEASALLRAAYAADALSAALRRAATGHDSEGDGWLIVTAAEYAEGASSAGLLIPAGGIEAWRGQGHTRTQEREDAGGLRSWCDDAADRHDLHPGPEEPDSEY